MNSPLISVIIPTHNRADYLGKAVDSVLSQRYGRFELIVVDDGSRDGTRKVLSRREDRRLQYICIEHAGVSKSRNIGVRNSQGAYIAFLDSDDYWHPDKLARQVKYHLDHPEVSISQTQEIWIRKGRRVNPRKKHLKPSGHIFPQSLHLCTITPSSVMMRPELFRSLGGFDEDMPACEDYDLWLRLTAAHQVGLIDEALLTKLGGHEGQLSGRYPAMERFRLYSLGKLMYSGCLNDQQTCLAKRVFEEKCSILLNGIRKRDLAPEALLRFMESLSRLALSPDDFYQLGRYYLLSDHFFQ